MDLFRSADFIFLTDIFQYFSTTSFTVHNFDRHCRNDLLALETPQSSDNLTFFLQYNVHFIRFYHGFSVFWFWFEPFTCMYLHKHQKLFSGKTTNRVREIFSKQGCRRDALNAAFTLSNAHSKDFFLLVMACINFKLFELRGLQCWWSLAKSLPGAVLLCG